MFISLTCPKFVYYIPNVLVQITTLVFLAQDNLLLRYVITPTATAVASAQSLRITRKIWKIGRIISNGGNDFVAANLGDIEVIDVAVHQEIRGDTQIC